MKVSQTCVVITGLQLFLITNRACTSLLTGGSPVLAPKTTASPPDKVPVPLKVNLLQFRKNVSELRIQLHQMRQLQARPFMSSINL